MQILPDRVHDERTLRDVGANHRDRSTPPLILLARIQHLDIHATRPRTLQEPEGAQRQPCMGLDVAALEKLRRGLGKKEVGETCGNIDFRRIDTTGQVFAMASTRSVQPASSRTRFLLNASSWGRSNPVKVTAQEQRCMEYTLIHANRKEPSHPFRPRTNVLECAIHGGCQLGPEGGAVRIPRTGHAPGSAGASRACVRARPGPIDWDRQN